MRIRFKPHFIRQALKNIRDHLGLHILGMGTMMAAMFIVGVFLLLYLNLGTWLEQWGNTQSMAVYLDEGISDYKRDKVERFVRELPGRKKLRYISKKEAMKDLKRALGDDAALLERLNRNPLPACYEVIFARGESRQEDMERQKKALEKLDGVTDVQTSLEWGKGFFKIKDMFRTAGLFMGALLCLCALFIVSNTIKIMMYDRKEEIEILKLVGATDVFIKVPFMLEGLFHGFVSGVLSLLSLMGGYFFFATKEVRFFGMSALDFNFLPMAYMTLLVLLSTLLGLLGSLLAVRKAFEF